MKSTLETVKPIAGILDDAETPMARHPYGPGYVNIEHPRKISVPLIMGQDWGNDGCIYQEKLDGEFYVLPIHSRIIGRGNDILCGELLRHRRFVAWDCVGFEGQDVRAWALADRLAMMGEICRDHGIPMAASSTNGGELLRRVLAAGGEGVVQKLPSSTYFDTMAACKRSWIWICRVRGVVGGSQSVEIEDSVSGQFRGRVALRGGKCDQVRPGSLIRVEGMSLTDDGKIREPRACREWLVSF